MSEPDLPELDRWLYVGTTLIKVTPGSTGPDVFCKLLDAEAAIATERARADALEAALSDVLEMAQEHADHFAAAFAGYKPERHAYYARALATARALLEKKT